MGEYSKTKGPQILLNALKKIKEPYEANFYGGGVLKKSLIKQAKDFDLNVKIHDKIGNGEVPKVIERHDIVVVPSFVGEALGKVAIEARAAGKTVVASNVGGIPNVISDKTKGILFEPGNSEELSKILKDIITDEIKLNPKFIRKDIEKFSLQKIIPKIKRVYKSLINS